MPETHCGTNSSFGTPAFWVVICSAVCRVRFMVASPAWASRMRTLIHHGQVSGGHVMGWCPIGNRLLGPAPDSACTTCRRSCSSAPSFGRWRCWFRQHLRPGPASNLGALDDRVRQRSGIREGLQAAGAAEPRLTVSSSLGHRTMLHRVLHSGFQPLFAGLDLSRQP